MKLAYVRNAAVNKICNSLHKARDMKLEIDMEKLIYEVCATYMVARRTAIEYIKTAQSKFNRDISKEEKNLLESEAEALDAQVIEDGK